MYFQDNLIFFPGPWPKGYALPQTLKHCGLMQLELTTPDKVKIDALYAHSVAKATPGEKVILFSHGNAGNLIHRLSKIDRMCEAGFNVLIYDYRGFGRSTGSPDVRGAIIDGQTALDWLLKDQNIAPENIILYGESLGTGIAAELLKNNSHNFAGLVLESGFASLGTQASRRFPAIGAIILKHDLPTIETLHTYKGPLLLIHSKQDEIIPYGDSEAMLAACPSEKKSLFTIEKMGHNSPVWELPQYLETWQNFATLLAASQSEQP